MPRRLLEQLWPPHPRPLPPQASVTDLPDTFARIIRPPPAVRVTYANTAPRRVPRTSRGDDEHTGPGDDGKQQFHLRPNATLMPTALMPTALMPTGRLPATAAAKLLAALPAFPAPFTLPSSASDAWAVDGRWTDTGAPLLAGDPHLSFDFPGLWYLVRIETPGHVLVGATAPGGPFLVMGHNGSIAWTFTTTGADTQDVYSSRPTSRSPRTRSGSRSAVSPTPS